MMRLSSCFDANAALDLVAGRLNDETATNMRVHLDDCDDCREVMTALARSQRSASESADGGNCTLLPYPGSTIGRYEVDRLVGIGGMAMVYCARDPKLDRQVALKLVHADQDATNAQRQLARESKIMAGLAHSNIATIYDVGEWQGHVYVALEYADKGTVKDWLSEEQHSWQDVCRVFCAAGDGLVAAHGLGVIHGDFKPSNLLVTSRGDVKVCDFGLAHMAEETENTSAVDIQNVTVSIRSDVWAGTPAYMAPEQYAGLSTSEKTDQFSFCVALYEALYKQRPFAGETVAEISNSMQDGTLRSPPRGTEVPQRIWKLLSRGLSQEPSKRFSSMAELLEALPTAAPHNRRRRSVILAVGTLVALGILGVFLAIGRVQGESSKVIANVSYGDSAQTALASRANRSECDEMADSEAQAVCFLLQITTATFDEDDTDDIIQLTNHYVESQEGGDPCFLAHALAVRGEVIMKDNPVLAIQDFSRSRDKCPKDDQEELDIMWGSTFAEAMRFEEATAALESVKPVRPSKDDQETFQELLDAIETGVPPSKLREENELR